MIRAFRCDLHIHSCLSPCADLEMSPRALVRKSIDEGLDIIAVCDHNASENVRYVIKAAEGTNLVVFPGMEVTSSEEVHVLALFESQEALQKLQARVYEQLPGQNDESIFGCQAIVNEQDEVEGLNERLLIGATGIPLDEIVRMIHELGGLAVASHVDREGFSILGQLGFIPKELPLDAIVIETDAPDLAPAWVHDRRNLPTELPRIGDSLAQLRGITPEALAHATSVNAMAVLPRLKNLIEG